MKDRVTSKLSDEKLQPLIKFVHGRRGAISEIVRRLSKRTRKAWRRENAERWLHSDPKRRTQPLFGVGLMLVEIGQEYISESESKPDNVPDQRPGGVKPKTL